MRPTRLAVFASLTLAAACASDSTSPASDINALVDESATATYSSAATGAALGAPLMALPPVGSSSCAYSSTSRRFECAPVTINGLTITRSFALLDANGAPLSVANPATVASINTVTDLKGTIAPTPTVGMTGPMTLAIDRHEDATLSQLQSATHVLNGTATTKTDMVTGALSMSSNETSTTSNLQLPTPSRDVHWPLGGTITTDRTMTVTGAPSLPPTHEVITFNGTSVMTLTRTTGTLTTTCKIDLAKPGLPICS